MRAAAATSLLLALVAAPGLAQEPRGSMSLAGPAVQRFVNQDSRVSVLGYRRTDLRASGLGVDAAVGVVPAALRALTLALHGDIGIARAVRASRVTLLLQGGISNFIVLGHSLEFYPGLQAGTALMVPLEARLVLRLDLARRVYLASDEPYHYWSMGLSLPIMTVR